MGERGGEWVVLPLRCCSRRKGEGGDIRGGGGEKEDGRKEWEDGAVAGERLGSWRV